MDRFSKVAIAIYLLAGLIGFVAYWYPGSGPDLDHPIGWRRMLNRVLGYAYANFISCLFSPLLFGALAKTHAWLGGPAPQIRDTVWSGVLLIAGPVPLAVAIFRFLLRCQRRSRRRTLKVLRRNGVLPPIVPLPGTPSPIPYRADGFDALDLRDDEIVRELARSHWQAINHAVASNGDADAAHAAQFRFLDQHLAQLDPVLAKHVRDVYVGASVEPSRELARIASLKREQARDLRDRRENFLRHSLILSIVAAVLALLGLILRLMH